MTKSGPGETPEIASAARVPSARRMAAAVTRSMSGSRRLCTAPTYCGGLAGGPEQGVDQVVADVGEDAAAGGLRVEPPGAVGPAEGGQPGLGEGRA